MHDSTNVREVLEARTDWITCTGKRGSKDLDLAHYADCCLEDQQANGERMKPWTWRQYHGFQCGNWRTGWGREGSIVIVSQSESADAAARLAQLADHWSRVDYCVTVYEQDPHVNWADRLWREWGRSSQGLRSRTKITRVQTRPDGDTLYIGDRASSDFIRVYDKHAESPRCYPRGCWRFELERKREASELAQKRWAAEQAGSAYILNVLNTAFDRYGLRVPLKASERVGDRGRIHRERQVDKTLQWLEGQVQQSVEFAMQAVGRDEVRRVLNI